MAGRVRTRCGVFVRDGNVKWDASRLSRGPPVPFPLADGTVMDGIKSAAPVSLCFPAKRHGQLQHLPAAPAFGLARASTAVPGQLRARVPGSAAFPRGAQQPSLHKCLVLKCGHELRG